MGKGTDAKDKSGTYEVRCLNQKCGVLNRVGRYTLSMRPVCQSCGWALPETRPIQLVRAILSTPLIWVACGVGIVVIGFTFLDRYLPSRGILGNAVTGTVFGVPYRYLFAAGIVAILAGLVVLARQRNN